jgi:looped-hinge helix DNA binding domain, AbrB family
MSKVTSKFQISIPRSFADQLRIKPGDEIAWRVTGEELRISPAKAGQAMPTEKRLELFDAATKRQAARNRTRGTNRTGSSRGWRREDLYDRGRTR